MGTAIAAKRFEFPIFRYDDKELDRSKTKWFEEGEELPITLVEILEKGNPEFVEYKDGKSKLKDVSSKTTKKEVKGKVYNKEQAYDLTKEEQIKELKARGITDIGKLEEDRVKQILKTNPK